jgi:hypothetical protein
MFTQLKEFTNQDEFIKGLFLEPGSKAVTTYDGKNEIVDKPIHFFVAANQYLDLMVLPKKKFKKIINFDQEIKTLLGLLTSKDKFYRQMRPVMTKLFYNAVNSEIVGTDAHIMLCYASHHILSNENILIDTDKLGNIITIKEKDYEGSKYPDYQSIFPIYDENDEKHVLTDLLIDQLFYLVKLAKICKLKTVPIKIGNGTYDGFLLTRLIEAFKMIIPNYNFILRVPKFNRAAYFSENDGKYKGLIMPLMDSGEMFTYKLI